MSPGRARSPGPPQTEVTKINRTGCLGEDHRTRLQVLDGGTGEVGRIQRSLGYGQVPCRVDEGCELCVGDLVGPDQNPSTATGWAGPSSG